MLESWWRWFKEGTGGCKQEINTFLGHTCHYLEEESKKDESELVSAGHPDRFISKPEFTHKLWLQVSKLKVSYMQYVAVIAGAKQPLEDFISACIKDNASNFTHALMDHHAEHEPLYGITDLTMTFFPKIGRAHV